ncbi:MAG TPA: glycosyltransferase [Candidatus Limnocylindria bacterium]|nr:glycosyltransferase [Candidatus Limnocylindria bacterium]
MPDVSFTVVIPAHDASAYLASTLAAVHAQTHPAADVIVVDDGSTDGTAALARSLGATVLQQANAGPSAARNAGVARARHDWIAFLDADDRWSPGYLAAVARAVVLCPDVRVIFANYAIAGEGDDCADAHAADRHFREIVRRTVAPGIARCDRQSLLRAYLRSRRFIQTSALAVRRDAFLDCGGYDESLRIAEDFELLLRLFAHSTAVVLEETLSTYRRHPSNATRDALVNFAWERHVWARIAAAPDRYPIGIAERLTAMRPAHLRAAGVMALRCGSFADARLRFEEARAAGAFGAGTGSALVELLDTPVGRAAFGVLRSAWRRRRAARST